MQNKRILKNTLLLYCRQILIIFVSLYSLRVLLGVLGIQNYGVLSVVSGFVALGSFLPTAMASASQRYISYALGKGDQDQLAKAVSVNWAIYCAIAVIAFLTLETIGYWFVSHHLKLPQQTYQSSLTLYHLTTVSFVLSILAAPFWALMIAHEDINLFASISIVDASLKLCTTLALAYLPWNKLELYGWMQFSVTVLMTLLYAGVCFRKYPYAGYKSDRWDKKLFSEILSFTGWTLFGQLTSVVRNQAVTVLLNQLTNPGIVAARALAVNVAAQVVAFSINFNTGLYPPIIKAYASNDRAGMLRLVFSGSKLTFFLTWIFAFPLLRGMQFVYEVWLKTVPPDATLFTQLALIETLIMSLSYPIATAARAPGNMRLYELSLGSIQLAILPVSALCLSLGFPPSSVFVVAIGANIFMFAVRLVIVKMLIGLSKTAFLNDVVAPILRVVAATCALAFIVTANLPRSFEHNAIKLLIDLMIAAISIYFFGLDKDWRSKLNSNLRARITSLKGSRR